jgi:acyl transferase domain-containing protein/NAD(P)H-dependent flavin oxidoreductase YrpB (nitropropane dioxygenase family)
MLRKYGMTQFDAITVTPLELPHPGLAVATARAGAIAILDGQFCRDLEQGDRNLRRLIELAAPDAILGLRLRIDQIESCEHLLEQLRGRAHWLVIARGAVPALVPAGLKEPGRVVVAEVADAAELGLAPDADAFLARGSECGGWVGGDAAFILTQKVLAATDRPVYVQGGIGPATAAACRAAGASGVVLDDQLWLMPESPLPAPWKAILEGIDGPEAQALGEHLGASCRVLLRPDLAGALRLQRTAAIDLTRDLTREQWIQEAQARVGWSDPDQTAWPMGQAAGLASGLRDRYKTTGRLLRAVLDVSAEQVKSAARLRPLAVDSPLALSHRTRCPIVQGPMTRVSDTPAFAEAVAAGGGLPLLALALMTGEEARRLFDETRARLGERSWGVGILGFVPPDRRDEQLAELVRARPPFALIAGGRPDQAAELERHGVATYLHVPVRTLLPLFLEGGVRRFVFEGRECGGHIGPLSSFVLWESMIATLLHEVPKSESAKVHILFAGGIHDARSAAMVAAMAAPLSERGMKVGVLMGSAYLFTEEAVSSGAIAEEFQQQALDCRRTVKLKTGPGHVVRCAPSPFAEEFEAARRRMTAEGRSNEEINDALALLALGRSRAGAKGVLREGGELVAIDRDRQRREGMFMMGSLATMRSSVVTIAELHDSVAIGGQEMLEDAVPADRSPYESRADESRPADVAIIGIATLLPGATAPRTYWRNILDKTNAITEIPKHRWDWRLLYSEDTKDRDKSFSKWGGFLDEIPFDPVRFGIPPNSMTQLSTSQLLTLEVARQALADAGYENGGFDRENTSVILGAAGNGDLEQGFVMRSLLPFVVDSPTPEMWQRLPEWSDEAFAGSLANVTAGRIANRLDLGGANYTVDAACASSLTAVDLAVHELRGGHSAMVVAGGLDLEQHPYFFLGFSRTQAFSPRGKVQSFDRNADGIVISEGVVVVVMKRLADAERDGDRIYAVIKSVAGSSDGKALGLTAPRPIGQRRAVTRAYRAAGFSPSTIGLYEAHGTGTPVGDRAELETIVGALDGAGATAKSCAVGSVKSLIGHTKAAAGMAGLVKAAYALYYRTLPPHAGVDEPLAALADPKGPAYLLREARPWFENGGTPRRAGVSAFGFGGTNFHAVLEEYRQGVATRAPGGDEWPYELVVVRAADRQALASEIRSTRDALAVDARLSDVAAARAKTRSGNAVLAVVSDSLQHLRAELDAALRHLEQGQPLGASSRLRLDAPSTAHKIAFLFPGQGAQHVNMGRELALYTPEMRASIELADRLTRGSYDQTLSRVMFPEAVFDAESEQRQSARVDDTHVAQPAIGALSLGYLDLARRLGLEPSMVAGHSFGELTALHAAGALDRESFLKLAETRGRLMAEAESGAMAAVSMSAEDLEPRLRDLDGVVIANRNAPRQCVISGRKASVEAAVTRLRAEGAAARLLPVSGAFHSPLMAGAEQPLTAAIHDCAVNEPAVPVYSNMTARPYPSDPDEVRAQLGAHLRSPVNFLGQVQAMAQDGATVFIELGPKGVLTGLVQQTFEQQNSENTVAVSLGTGGLRGFLTGLATLIASGVAIDVEALFAGRDVHPDAKPETRSQSWWVDGGGVRRTREEPRDQIGALPRLDWEAVQKNAENQMTRPAAPPPPAAPSSDLLEAYRSYQETMRQFLAVQESVMSRFLGGSSALPAMPSFPATVLPPMPAIAALPQPAPAIPATFAELPAAVATAAAVEEPQMTGELAAAMLDRESLSGMIVSLVSQRTGYPAEVLGLEQDIEAELGIDSIKRMEIVDSIVKRLAPATVVAPDELLRLKTLNGWIGVVLRAQETPAAAPPAAVESQPRAEEQHDQRQEERREEPTDERIDAEPPTASPRFVIRGFEEPAPLFSLTRLRGLFLVTEDTFGIAGGVASSLRQLGAEVAVLSRELLASPDAIEAFIAEQRAELGAVQGVVHLAPLAPSGMAATLDDWRDDASVSVKSLFHILRAASADLRRYGFEGEAYALGAAFLGGAWGRNGVCGPGSPSAGGVYGVLKTLTNEMTGVHAKAVDFDDVSRPAEMVSKILVELLARSDDFEVGYTGGVRSVFRAEALAVATPEPRVPPVAAGDVLLITGGARGITAQIARALAVPGVRIILAGRSPEPSPEDPATAHRDEAELRRHFLGLPRAAGERITPVQIEEQIRAVMHRREARETVDALRRAGAEVEYRRADMRNENDVAALLDGIHARFGRLDGVIHGAGIIEDRLLSEKETASFDRVFDTKADSAFLLASRLRPETLRFVVLFSSVAGRIGNRGQVDYAAANEVVNRLAWSMSASWSAEHRGVQVVAINWGPWSGAGMASPAVIRQLEERGIEAVSPSAGREFLLQELVSGARDCEVLAGQGPWSSDADSLLASVIENAW